MEKDNQGLFDFECHELKKRTYEVQSDCLVIANDHHKVIRETTGKPCDVEVRVGEDRLSNPPPSKL